jgi:L-ascorbate metabolism protein UlaG (beta-lactamase superfamily)
VKRRFENLHGFTWAQSPWPLLRWRLTRRLRRHVWLPVRDTRPAVRPNDGRALRAGGAHLTWVGHATFLLRLGGRLVAIDPMWSERCVHVKRLRPAAPALEDLPEVDVVTVSHSHFDHLDLPSLRRLAERFQPTFLVPLQVGRILRRGGIRDVVELDWWDSHASGDLRLTLVPANHWSARGPFDVNRTLWGGFVYEGPEGVAYHGGDTAFEPRLFEDIAERFPRIDWAMLPIGAYEPEWFLGSQHVNPEDAGRAFELLGARHFVPAHWGTFRLTDEPDGEPIRRAEAWFQARSRADRLWAMDVGETRTLA